MARLSYSAGSFACIGKWRAWGDAGEAACVITPSPLMGEGWGEGGESGILPLPSPLPRGERGLAANVPGDCCEGGR